MRPNSSEKLAILILGGWIPLVACSLFIYYVSSWDIAVSGIRSVVFSNFSVFVIMFLLTFLIKFFSLFFMDPTSFTTSFNFKEGSGSPT